MRSHACIHTRNEWGDPRLTALESIECSVDTPSFKGIFWTLYNSEIGGKGTVRCFLRSKWHWLKTTALFIEVQTAFYGHAAKLTYLEPEKCGPIIPRYRQVEKRKRNSAR